MFKKFFNNTRKPEGFGGKVMLNMMNSGHSRMASWGFNHVKAKKDWNVLDIGCGGGANIKHWLELCSEGSVTGVDYSPESVAKSKKVNAKSIETGRCKVLEANVLNMPFNKNSFDFISAFETVYFWNDIKVAFVGIYKILKKGGSFMIVNEASDDSSKKWENIIDGMKVYKKEELIGFLKETGFEISVVDSKIKPSWLVIIAKKI